jgi:hypothetical protein
LARKAHAAPGEVNYHPDTKKKLSSALVRRK